MGGLSIRGFVWGKNSLGEGGNRSMLPLLPKIPKMSFILVRICVLCGVWEQMLLVLLLCGTQTSEMLQAFIATSCLYRRVQGDTASHRGKNI